MKIARRNSSGRRAYLARVGTVEPSGGIVKAPLATRAKSKLKAACPLDILPVDLSVEAKCAMVRESGFFGIEVPPFDDLAEADRVAEMARDMDLSVHAVAFGGWRAPLSDPAPLTRQQGREGLERALICAQAMGADAVTFVPGVVNRDVRYRDAYDRSQAEIRSLVPLAESLKVTLAIENVWNHFLLSPLECAQYVDIFDSERVKVCFNAGCAIAHGWAEDWILTLGSRIGRLRLTDVIRETREWTRVGNGDVDWQSVRSALREIGYEGWVTCEDDGSDEFHLLETRRRMSAVIPE